MEYSVKRQVVIDRVVCILRIVTIFVLLATVLIGRHNKPLAVANIALSVIALLIWVLQPQYICEEKHGLFAWSSYRANETDLLLCVMFPPLLLGMRLVRDYLILDWTMLIGVSLVAAVLVGIALLTVFKPKGIKLWQYACISLMICLCVLGICAQLNVVLDFSKPEVQRCQVVNQRKAESRHRGPDTINYYWIVVTETGEELEIPVTQAQYDTVLKGAIVPVKFSKGALGIPYAYVEYKSLWYIG